jgi:hypothetical protein
MKQSKKKINYFPYKIFQKNIKNRPSKMTSFNSTESFPQHKKLVLDISKDLKSVAISNKLYTDYIVNYDNLTKEFCFKSPGNNNYPLRKNMKYLSVSCKKNMSALYKQEKINNKQRPFSSSSYKNKANVRFRLYKEGNKYNNKKIKLKIGSGYKQRNFNSNLLLSMTENEQDNKSLLTTSKINNNIDLDNNKKTQSENFEYLKKYIIGINRSNINDNFDKSELSHTDTFQKSHYKYQLNIYSICLKFAILNQGKINRQNLFIKFKCLPIFYLLDYQTFKVFLSEIIYYNNKTNNFEIVKNNFDEIYNKYCQYINKTLDDKNSNDNIEKINKLLDITFYKNEFNYPYIYKWFAYNKNNQNTSSNDNNDEKDKISVELKIAFPEIQLKILNCDTIIRSNLKKSLMVQLMKDNFIKWEDLILSELFFIKKFRYIINSILLSHGKYFNQDINLSHHHYNTNNSYNDKKVFINKNFEFFISEINENKSYYYIFNPFTITLNGKKIDFHQDIHLTLEESRILYKFGKYWGIMNTLLKCININEITSKISFKFDLLENISPKYFNLNKSQIKAKKEHMKFRFNKIDIIISECSLKKIIISNASKQEKFFKIPHEFLKLILSSKDNHKKNNLNFDNSIFEYCKEIRKEKEIDNKKEHKKIIESELEHTEKSFIEKKPTVNLNKTNINMKNSNKNIQTEVNTNVNYKSCKIINHFIHNQNNDKDESKDTDILIDKDNSPKNKNKKNKSKIFLTKDFNASSTEDGTKSIINNINNIISRGLNESDKKEEEKNNKNNNQKKLRNSLNNQALWLIHNKNDLAKNRTMRDNFYLNNEIGIQKLRQSLVNLNHRKEFLNMKK